MTSRKECEKIYHEAFGIADGFDELLFDSYFDNTQTLTLDGKTVSMLFKIPCVVDFGSEQKTAYYLYAVATDRQYRGRGLMSALIKRCCDDENALYFLKPATEPLQKFYEQLGFYRVPATPLKGADAAVAVEDKHSRLSQMCKKITEEYTLMFSGSLPREIKKVYFKDTLE